MPASIATGMKNLLAIAAATELKLVHLLLQHYYLLLYSPNVANISENDKWLLYFYYLGPQARS